MSVRKMAVIIWFTTGIAQSTQDRIPVIFAECDKCEYGVLTRIAIVTPRQHIMKAVCVKPKTLNIGRVPINFSGAGLRTAGLKLLGVPTSNQFVISQSIYGVADL